MLRRGQEITFSADSSGLLQMGATFAATTSCIAVGALVPDGVLPDTNDAWPLDEVVARDTDFPDKVRRWCDRGFTSVMNFNLSIS